MSSRKSIKEVITNSNIVTIKMLDTSFIKECNRTSNENSYSKKVGTKWTTYKNEERFFKAVWKMRRLTNEFVYIDVKEIKE